MTTKSTKQGNDRARGNRDSKGRWLKGSGSPNPAGRPKLLGEYQEYARQYCPEAIDTLRAIMTNPKTSAAARVAASTAMLDRGLGKPLQSISQTLKTTDPASLTDEELAGIVTSTKQNGSSDVAH